MTNQFIEVPTRAVTQVSFHHGAAGPVAKRTRDSKPPTCARFKTQALNLRTENINRQFLRAAFPLATSNGHSSAAGFNSGRRFGSSRDPGTCR